MSLFYTTEWLWWNGRRGQAQCDGVSRDLERAPDVLPEIAEIDYCPEFHTAEIRPRPCDRRRDLEAPEVEAIRRWLHCFANSVKRELGM